MHMEWGFLCLFSLLNMICTESLWPFSTFLFYQICTSSVLRISTSSISEILTGYVKHARMIQGNTDGQQQIWLQKSPSSSSPVSQLLPEPPCQNKFTLLLLNKDIKYQTSHMEGVCVRLPSRSKFSLSQISELFWHLVQNIQDYNISTKHYKIPNTSKFGKISY